MFSQFVQTTRSQLEAGTSTCIRRHARGLVVVLILALAFFGSAIVQAASPQEEAELYFAQVINAWLSEDPTGKAIEKRAGQPMSDQSRRGYALLTRRLAEEPLLPAYVVSMASSPEVALAMTRREVVRLTAEAIKQLWRLGMRRLPSESLVPLFAWAAKATKMKTPEVCQQSIRGLSGADSQRHLFVTLAAKELVGSPDLMMILENAIVAELHDDPPVWTSTPEDMEVAREEAYILTMHNSRNAGLAPLWERVERHPDSVSNADYCKLFQTTVDAVMELREPYRRHILHSYFGNLQERHLARIGKAR